MMAVVTSGTGGAPTMMTKVTSSVDRTSGTTKRSHSWPSAVGEHVTPPEPTPVTKSTRASPTGSKWSDSSGVVGLPLESTGWAAISTTGLSLIAGPAVIAADTQLKVMVSPGSASAISTLRGQVRNPRLRRRTCS